MSKFDALLTEHCPNGVQYKPLHEIFNIGKGCEFPGSNSNLTHDSSVYWFRLADIYRNGAILHESANKVAAEDVQDMKLSPANSIVVATLGNVRKHALIKTPHLSDSCFSTLSLKPYYSNRIDIHFANYYCFILDNWCYANSTGFGFISVDLAGFNNFKFPLPPLEVQKEIVRFLNNFTELVSELEAEQKIRSQQYDFHINALLSFDRIAGNSEKQCVKWCPLGKIGKFICGSSKRRTNQAKNHVGFIDPDKFINEDVVFMDKTSSFITKADAKEYRMAQNGDLIIASNSTADRNVGRAVVWMGDADVAVSDDAFIFRHELNPKYVAYFFKTEQFQELKRPYITGAIPRWINVENLCKIEVPVPSLKEQERIVAILDRFGALVNDSSCGIPAEILARKKQQEHYLNKFLNFKEATFGLAKFPTKQQV